MADKISKLTVQERVANGARWLDENFPGWEKRIGFQINVDDDLSAYDVLQDEWKRVIKERKAKK